MSCARTGRRQPRDRERSAFGRQIGPILLLLVVAGLGRPALAQTPAGGFAPSVLPPLPEGPIGLPNPSIPPSALPGGNLVPGQAAEPAPAPYSLALPPVGLGVVPLQAANPNAPAILIVPQLSLGERFTDNVNYTATNRQAAAETRILPGVSISADTPRLQGVLTGNIEGDVYLPSRNLDQFLGSMYASGLGTVVPDKLFVQAKSSISVASAIPGLGFTSPTLLPRQQQTQVFVNNVSPYLRESIDGYVDTELRYTFGATNFLGNTGVAAPIGSPAFNNNLTNGVLNEGTFTAATGQNFERALSRLTVDASNFNSSSTSRNNQFNAFDDLEYRITPDLAALARVGYQDIHYPFAPAATFTGATWLVGGRIGLAANYAYLSLEYGVQQGVYGFTGSAFYQITPTMAVTATLVQGISSPSQYLQTALSSSSLNPYGSIVDQYSGLPTAFYNPGLGLTNNVYREHLFNIGITDTIGYNQYSLYGVYVTQQPLTPPITAETKSIGANFGWNRSIRPDLNGQASLGVYNTTNAISFTTGVPVNNTNTITANLGVNYLLSETLVGSVLYTFSYQTNGGAVVSGTSGNVWANSLQFLLTKTF